MSFLQPLAFLLIGLIPIVIAMYLLKLRRTEQQVSSIYLWRRMVRDVEANAPWQRLRRNLLLLLQLLFLAALTLALARPFSWTQGSGSQSTILIVDVSASMAATDVSPNRLEVAVGQARRLINDLPDDARVTVIAASNTAQVLVSSSQDRRQAYQALDRLQIAYGGSNLEDALELASAIAARQPGTEIVVLSDGKTDLPERLAIQGQLRYLPIGTEENNQAIGLLTVELAPKGDSLVAFAQVTNYAENSDEPALRRISFYADGQLIQAFDLEIPAADQQVVLVEGIPPETQVVEARLTGEDLLAIDDQAAVVYRPAEPVQVLLVSEGNRFLETGLNLLPGMELTSISPKDWEASAGALTTDQNVPRLTIFDVHVPLTRTMPAESILFIGPLRSTDWFTVTGTVPGPIMEPVEADDPLLSGLTTLDTIRILDATRLANLDWARTTIIGTPVENSGEEPSPLLVYGEPQGQRVAVLGFDLRRSDLPLQVAFPILLSNLINWLAPPSINLPAMTSPGQSLSFTLPQNESAVSLRLPDQTILPLENQNNRWIIPQVNLPGVYQVFWGEGQQALFAVNLFSPQESNIKPADQLPILGQDPNLTSENQQFGRREWWRPLVWLALLIVVLEWLVYNRANLRRVWDQLRRRLYPQETSSPRIPPRPSQR
jgi:Ca-activated chloride channel homolog